MSAATETLADKLARMDTLRAENAAGDPPMFERRVADAATIGDPIVARDLLDMAATAREISVDLKYAGDALGDAFEGYRDEAKAKAGALALLHSAAAGIAELITEIEGAA